jgi:hypothetical protein
MEEEMNLEINIEELADAVMQKIDASKKSDRTVWERGKKYFIRTVTNYLTGRLVEVTGQELVIEDAAWIADTGRFADALKKAKFSEVEPYPDGRVIIGRGSVIDACEWTRGLPREQL